MQKLKKFCLSLAILMASTYILTACEGILPDTTLSSDYPSNSPFESVNSGAGSSSGSDNTSTNGNNSSSNDIPEKNPMWDIVDAAYELTVGNALEGTYQLTGTVTYVKFGKNDVIKIVVAGRESKPIQCYGITGVGVSDLKVGDTVTVSGELINYEYTIEFNKGCVLLSSSGTGGDTITPPIEEDPYSGVSKAQFYLNYSPATSNTDAYYRSLHGFMSGSLTVPDQAPTVAKNQPKNDSKLIRNSQMKYSDNGNAYTVVDANGNDAFTVYRQGGYITLEEVAAFVYAFGTFPANHTTSKEPNVTNSIWGEYLRANHTRFSGDTSQYPYEPVLPNISGCGGSLTYYEMDVGTTGTDCDPIKYPPRIYNDGNNIDRGAARIVYGKNDLNKNGIYELNEHHLFYTYNHYNDFQEYLNYEGGWGEIFGNITGGGSISSKYDYNPTPYVSVCLQELPMASVLAKTPSLANYKTLLIASN